MIKEEEHILDKHFSKLFTLSKISLSPDELFQIEDC